MTPREPVCTAGQALQQTIVTSKAAPFDRGSIS